MPRGTIARRSLPARRSRSIYLLTAYADFLLRRGRPAAVIELLESAPAADPLLLRLALAEARTDRRAAARVATLRYRLELALRGDDRAHAREAAFFALYLDDDATHALSLALDNWTVQREEIDARLVLEAAAAAEIAERGAAGARLAREPRCGARGASELRQPVRRWAMIRHAAWLLLMLAASDAFGHEPSRSLVTLDATGEMLRGRWDISLRDLEDAVGLDADGDSAVSWGEVVARRGEIVAYALPRLRVTADSLACMWAPISRVSTSMGERRSPCWS